MAVNHHIAVSGDRLSKRKQAFISRVLRSAALCPLRGGKASPPGEMGRGQDIDSSKKPAIIDSDVFSSRSYAVNMCYTIRRQMEALQFDRCVGFISEGQFQEGMAALRKKAAWEREQQRWKPTNPHEEKRVGKALLGCVLVFHLLIPFTPVVEIRDTFAIEPLSWFVAMLIISLPLCYIPALLLAAWTRKR